MVAVAVLAGLEAEARADLLVEEEEAQVASVEVVEGVEALVDEDDKYRNCYTQYVYVVLGVEKRYINLLI